MDIDDAKRRHPAYIVEPAEPALDALTERMLAVVRTMAEPTTNEVLEAVYDMLEGLLPKVDEHTAGQIKDALRAIEEIDGDDDETVL